MLDPSICNLKNYNYQNSDSGITGHIDNRHDPYKFWEDIYFIDTNYWVFDLTFTGTNDYCSLTSPTAEDTCVREYDAYHAN